MKKSESSLRFWETIHRFKGCLILLSVVLSVQMCIGQMPDSLKKYYELVNTAELAIVDSNYEKAMTCYNNAFGANARPFMKDIYNQAMCAVLLSDFNKAFSNFEHLVDYGYEVDSLQGKKVLQEFFSSEYGEDLILHGQLGKKKYDKRLRKQYDSLLLVDQEYRIKEGSYDVYGEIIQQIDSSNVVLVNRLIQEFGFPSQYLVGVYPNFDYLPIRILIIHNQDGIRFTNRFNYTETIYEAVYNGRLDVRAAIDLLTGSEGNDFYGLEVSGAIRHGYENDDPPDSTKLSPWGFFNLSADKEEMYDQRREGIGLCSLEDTRIKVIHQFKDHRFRLGDPAGLKIYYWADEKGYLDAAANMIYID